MDRGSHIILINGPSGSGKTCLCKQLIDQLYFPYVHISMDRFYEGLTQQPMNALQRACLPAVYQGFLASAAAFTTAGNRTLLDIVLVNRAMKESIFHHFAAIPTYLVGLNCSLETLQERNKPRKRRRTDLTIEQIASVHEDMLYDLQLDTEQFSPSQGADEVIRHLNNDMKPLAFTNTSKRFCHAH